MFRFRSRSFESFSALSSNFACANILSEPHPSLPHDRHARLDLHLPRNRHRQPLLARRLHLRPAFSLHPPFSRCRAMTTRACNSLALGSASCRMRSASAACARRRGADAGDVGVRVRGHARGSRVQQRIRVATRPDASLITSCTEPFVEVDSRSALPSMTTEADLVRECVRRASMAAARAEILASSRRAARFSGFGSSASRWSASSASAFSFSVGNAAEICAAVGFRVAAAARHQPGGHGEPAPAARTRPPEPRAEPPAPGSARRSPDPAGGGRRRQMPVPRSSRARPPPPWSTPPSRRRP